MTRTILIAAALTLAATLPAAPAQAAGRTFVSTAGSDSNPCSITLPCRNLQAAYNAVAANGQVDVLDPGNYGSLTITGPVTIQGHGWAGMSANTGAAITINAAGATDKIFISGVVLDGLGIVGTNGIVFNSGGSLNVRDSVVRNFTGNGIDFQPTTATSALTVSNSLAADNGINGIALLATGSATAVFNSVEANNNGEHGIFVNGEFSAGTNTINATVSDSVADGNHVGIEARSPTGAAPTSVMVFHSVAANNTSGGVSPNGTGATLRLANSTMTGNANGWLVQSSGVVASYGDNYIDGNGSNTGSLTPISRQ